MGTVSFSLAELSVSEVVGKGDYNVRVYLGQHKTTEKLVALKTFDLDTCDLNLKTVQHEIWMHRQLKHKNILSVFGCFTKYDNVYLVFPLMGYGSCKDLIHAHFYAGFPELAIAYILKDIVCALEYLHSKHIIHRSVKGSHILIGANGSAVLSGLRHCYSMLHQGTRLKAVHDFPKFYVSSLNWASRELLEQNLGGYTTKSDIYSLGILSCELGNGVIPFYDMPMTQMLLNKIEGNTPTLLDVTTYSKMDSKRSITNISLSENYKRTFSSYFHNFVKACLNYDPKFRPSASSLESHWFFRQTKAKHQPSLIAILLPLTPLGFKTTTPELKSVESTDAHDTDWIF